MDWASWSASLDRFLHSPNLPFWAAIAAAGFIALILIIALLRADKSVANGVLAAITLLVMGIAGYATVRGFGSGSDRLHADAQGRANMAMPALTCIDDLAGDAVLAACEKALFGSPESVAAAVSYASARLARLTSHGDAAAADRQMTPELARLRQSIERDRYGLVAHVLAAKDGCQASDCPAYRSLTDSSRIAANINERVYEAAVARHAPSWGGPVTAAAAPPPASQALAGVTDAPAGKPTGIDFPSSASIPPISIMTADPAPSPATAPAPSAVAPPPARAATANRAPPPNAGPDASGRPPAAAQASANRPAAAAAQTAAKKPPAPPKPKPAPVQLAPEDANADN